MSDLRYSQSQSNGFHKANQIVMGGKTPNETSQYITESLWGLDYEEILEQIRQNCVNQAKFHKKKYFFYVKLNQYFRLPTIALSAVVSVSSVGLQPYIVQRHISGLVCLVSLCIGVINSIEIFLKISENCELELETSKLFYHLATDIYKITSLDEDNRQFSGKEFLEEAYRRYVELMEKSNLLRATYKDTMIKLPTKRDLKGVTKRGFAPNDEFGKTFDKGLEPRKSPIPSSSSSSSGSSNTDNVEEEEL